jgi:signal transduction histidine kinase
MTPMLREPASELALFATVTADIARTLESPDDAEERIRHVLRLARQLIPYDRCALLRLDHAGRRTSVIVPDGQGPARAGIERLLDGLLELMATDEVRPSPIDGAARLALPIVGDGHVIGVLLAEGDTSVEYETHHVRFLSSIASQLGSYLALGRLHQAAAAHTRLLEEREREQESVARFREEFIGVIGHDLRVPLSAIMTGAHLLSLARQTAEDRDTATRILSSAGRMARMIDDLLDFTRGRLGGGIPIERRLVSTKEVCRHVLEELAASHPGRAIVLGSTGDDRAELDADRIAQMVSNLVGNALRYSPDDSMVRVAIDGDSEDGVTLRVCNQGAPIPPDDLTSVFEPFRRGRAHAPANGSGLGLGLYIVERIARAHGGSVTASSSIADGTCFTVWLPRVKGAAP